VLDQSLDYARLAIEEGEKFGHPATLCRSLIMILPVYLALDDWQRSEQYIAQLTDLSAAHSLKRTVQSQLGCEAGGFSFKTTFATAFRC